MAFRYLVSDVLALRGFRSDKYGCDRCSFQLLIDPLLDRSVPFFLTSSQSAASQKPGRFPVRFRDPAVAHLACAPNISLKMKTEKYTSRHFYSFAISAMNSSVREMSSAGFSTASPSLLNFSVRSAFTWVMGAQCRRHFCPNFVGHMPGCTNGDDV